MFGENVQMKVVCSAPVAEKILQHVAENYFEHYVLIAWVSDIEVMRGDHYVKPV